MLVGTNFTEGYEKFVVDHLSIEEEGANNALDAKDAVFIKGWIGWSVHCLLDLCSVVDLGVLVGGHDALERRIVDDKCVCHSPRPG